jgi:hypothetical protein
LIDNLDKSWDKNNDIDILSKYILGLLTVGSGIVDDLSLFKKKQTGISFRMIVFLRADIFRFIEKNAREPDKLQSIPLKWNDKESLFSIIEERFVMLFDGEVDYDELWEEYVVKYIDNEPIKDFVYNRILPRPRDIIYFFKTALEIAINRKHEMIEESDIGYAYSEYSNWVFKTVLVENGITIEEMEDFLYHLIGLHRIIRRVDIVDILEETKMIETKGDSIIDYSIDHLFHLSIIGKEVDKDDFRFYYGYEDLKKIDIQANKFESKRYLIHPAFYPFFEI